MSGKHSPLPWRMGRKIADVGITTGLFSAETELGRIYTGRDEFVANAEFIVRAVNSHDALVEAIRGIINTAEASTNVLGMEVHLAEAIVRARDVLALAEAK